MGAEFKRLKKERDANIRTIILIAFSPSPHLKQKKSLPVTGRTFAINEENLNYFYAYVLLAGFRIEADGLPLAGFAGGF